MPDPNSLGTMLDRYPRIPLAGYPTPLEHLPKASANLEIDQQVKEMNLERPHLVMAAGTGGTLAGLHAGLSLLDSPVRPLALDIGRLWKGFPESLARLTTEVCRRLGEKRRFRAESMPLLESVYAAPEYGVPSHGCRAAIRTLARLEGVLLDPVYTGKAFAGLLDLITKGHFGRDEPIIFLHTGGLPSLFAFDERVLCDE